jgi:hypothetical protein
MSKPKLITGIAILIVVVAGWYAFRPERLFINQKVSEQFPTASAASAQPATLVSGQFHGVAHETKGGATVYQLADGKRVLRFTNFETSNGPDVVVYLIAAGDAGDSDTVKNASPILLGSLKGNMGDQNYDLPADVDLSKYRAVTVWCRRFNVNFATAPLSRQQS